MMHQANDRPHEKCTDFRVLIEISKLSSEASFKSVLAARSSEGLGVCAG